MNILGGLGEAYVESRGTKLSQIHHHTGYISTTRKNNGNHDRGQKFYIYMYSKTRIYRSPRDLSKYFDI